MGDKKIIKQLLKKHSIEEVAEMLTLTKEEVISLSKDKKVSEECKEKINKLYKEGKTATEIAYELNLARRTVIRHIDNYKVIKKKVTKLQQEQIKIMYEKGKSYSYIAEIMELTEVTIRKVIKKLIPGIKTTKIKRLNDEEINILEKLYHQGESINDIAEILNVHRSTVSRQINKKIRNK